MNLQIREVKESDSIAIAELSIQLGYDINLFEAKEQLISIIKSRDQYAFVAIVDNLIIGFIHGFKALRLTTLPFMEIGGLILDEHFRRQGIASKLVKKLEEADESLKTIRVRCNVKREFAHDFYTHLDYQEKKIQKVFVKNLASKS